MEEINKIIQAISEVTGLDKWSVVYGRNKQCIDARMMLCYIVVHDFYSAISKLAQALGRTQKSCRAFAEDFRQSLRKNEELTDLTNDARAILGLSTVSEREKRDAMQRKEERTLRKIREISKKNVRRIFGLEYTEEDEKRFSYACRSAAEFMEKVCSVGLRDTERIVRSPY